jgi:hypothetical protein
VVVMVVVVVSVVMHVRPFGAFLVEFVENLLADEF